MFQSVPQPVLLWPILPGKREEPTLPTGLDVLIHFMGPVTWGKVTHLFEFVLAWLTLVALSAVTWRWFGGRKMSSLHSWRMVFAG
jgi:hypothetical protein